MELLKKPKLSIDQQKVYNHILEGINQGLIAVGCRLPPEVELANTLGVNRMNVQTTLQYLQSHGILARNKRAGTVVTMKPSPFMIGDLKRNISGFVTVLDPLDQVGERIHWNQEIHIALKRKLHENGLDLNVVSVSIGDLAAIETKLCELAQAGPVALLCISSNRLNHLMQNHSEIFFKYYRNVVVFGRDIIDWSFFPYNTVSVDLFHEGIIAAEYTFAHAYDKVFFGTCRYIEHCDWMHPRREGVRCGLQRLTDGKLTAKDIILEDSLDSAIKAINSGFRTMIVAANDAIAALYIDELNARLPDKVIKHDYGIISFDHDPAYMKYQLTTIAPPLAKIGQTLGELIVGITGRNNDLTSFIKIQSQLINGKTC